MKRIVGLLTALCLLFTAPAQSLATVRVDSITANSLPTGLSASDIEDETDKVFYYKERNNYAKVTLSDPIDGVIYISFQMKIKNKDYDDFRIQMVGSDGELRTVQFIPQDSSEGVRTTKVDPKPTGSSDGILNYDALPLNEWVTINLLVDTENESFCSSVTYSNGETKTIHTNGSFKTRTTYDFKQLMFAFNRMSGSPEYTGAYFKNFNIYRNVEVSSIAPINYEVEVGGEYTFPETVTATLENGGTAELGVTWNSYDIDTSVIGTHNFEGTVENCAVKALLSVEVKPLSIVSCDMAEVYLDRIDDSMPKYIKVKYSNDTYGFEEVIWDDVDRSANAVQQVSGTVAGFSGDVKANVYLYDLNSPLFEETCENYNDGEYLGGRYLSPLPRLEENDYWGWAANVPVQVHIEKDPTNEGELSICLPVTDDYSKIETGYGREGVAVVSYDLYFPDKSTDVRTIVGNKSSSSSLIEFSFDAETGTIKRIGGDYEWIDVFEPNRWINIKYIADSYTDSYDLFVNNIKIADDVPFRTLNQGDMYFISFANKSTDECKVYLDNVKMYYLTDMLEEAYNEIKLTETNVTGNLAFDQPTDASVTAKWGGDGIYIEDDGTVNRSVWKDGDKRATVYLVLTKEIGAGYTAEKRAAFTLTVKESDPTDAQAVANTLSSLTFEKIKNENTDEHNIMTDLTLPSAGEFNTVISWSSEPAGLIDSEGRVYAPKSADTTVNLTATVSRGSVTEIKQFPALTVKYQAELSDLQAVRRAMAELSVPSYASSSLSLPASGADGVKISWTSNNLSALSNSGVYKNPPRETTVTLTAILTKGSVRETKAFTIQVAAYSGGDSGGGGGIGGGAMTAPAVTPVTEPEKITPIYSDIEEYDWAKTAIYALTKEGVLTGTGNGRFEPERNVNREEFVAMAVRGFDITAEEKEIPFTDVSENDWHFETTKRAWSFGLISGISENSFGSGMEIKRQDIFVIMYNIVKELGISLKKVREAAEFTDSGDISDYALEAVSALYEAGIVNGYGDTIKPLKSATRAEAAKMIYEISRLQ